MENRIFPRFFQVLSAGGIVGVGVAVGCASKEEDEDDDVADDAVVDVDVDTGSGPTGAGPVTDASTEDVTGWRPFTRATLPEVTLLTLPRS